MIMKWLLVVDHLVGSFDDHLVGSFDHRTTSVWKRGHERTQGLYFSGKKSKREGLSVQKGA